MQLPGEFQLIAAHFRPLAGPEGLGLGDDAAIFTPPPGEQLVISTDAMVEHTHFLPNTDPALLARKLLRVNLSDLAAMGARPLGYLLTLCLPKPMPPEWLARFAAGLAEDQQLFGIKLWGGDTTSTQGPITLSITILGAAAPGRAVRRNGARSGDLVYVTGTIGDAALGLLAARGEIDDPDGYLAGRYHLPTPRNALPICGIASATMDVSDGLVAELWHIARASNLAIMVQSSQVPLSPQARRHARRLSTILTGGDDYELLLAVPPDREGALLDAARDAGVPVTCIGSCGEGTASVKLIDEHGKQLRLAGGGWSHF